MTSILKNVFKVEGENKYFVRMELNDIYNLFEKGAFNLTSEQIENSYSTDIEIMALNNKLMATVIELNAPLNTNIDYKSNEKEMVIDGVLDILDGLKRISSIIKAGQKFKEENSTMDGYIMVFINHLDEFDCQRYIGNINHNMANIKVNEYK